MNSEDVSQQNSSKIFLFCVLHTLKNLNQKLGLTHDTLNCTEDEQRVRKFCKIKYYWIYKKKLTFDKIIMFSGTSKLHAQLKELVSMKGSIGYQRNSQNKSPANISVQFSLLSYNPLLSLFV